MECCILGIVSEYVVEKYDKDLRYSEESKSIEMAT